MIGRQHAGRLAMPQCSEQNQANAEQKSFFSWSTDQAGKQDQQDIGCCSRNPRDFQMTIRQDSQADECSSLQGWELFHVLSAGPMVNGSGDEGDSDVGFLRCGERGCDEQDQYKTGNGKSQWGFFRWRHKKPPNQKQQ
jgi:hypothetical protein